MTCSWISVSTGAKRNSVLRSRNLIGRVDTYHVESISHLRQQTALACVVHGCSDRLARARRLCAIIPPELPNRRYNGRGSGRRLNERSAQASRRRLELAAIESDPGLERSSTVLLEQR